MTEKITYIPTRIRNAAKGGHVAGAEDIIDDALGKEQNQINQETILALNDRYAKSQTYNKTELDSMITTPNQKYVNLSAEDGDTLADIFDGVTGAADTIYRVGSWDGEQYDATVYSEYAFDGTNFVYLSTKTQVGEVFDISLAHASGGELAKYADLEAALGTDGANVPEGIRKGGMSVKFVQSSDNKYVQYRCVSDEFTTDVTQWQGVDDEPTAGSDNLVKSGGISKALNIVNNNSKYNKKINSEPFNHTGNIYNYNAVGYIVQMESLGLDGFISKVKIRKDVNTASTNPMQVYLCKIENNHITNIRTVALVSFTSNYAELKLETPIKCESDDYICVKTNGNKLAITTSEYEPSVTGKFIKYTRPDYDVDETVLYQYRDNAAFYVELTCNGENISELAERVEDIDTRLSDSENEIEDIEDSLDIDSPIPYNELVFTYTGNVYSVNSTNVYYGMKDSSFGKSGCLTKIRIRTDGAINGGIVYVGKVPTEFNQQITNLRPVLTLPDITAVGTYEYNVDYIEVAADESLLLKATTSIRLAYQTSDYTGLDITSTGIYTDANSDYMTHGMGAGTALYLGGDIIAGNLAKGINNVVDDKLDGVLDGIDDKILNAIEPMCSWDGYTIIQCGNGKPFASLYDAMNYAKEHASKEKKYEIQMFSSEIVTNINDLHLIYQYTEYELYCIVDLAPYVRIRGIGEMKTVALFLPDNTQNQDYYEPIHMEGNSEIENVHVICKNARYPIHFERGDANVNKFTKIYVRNCILEHMGGGLVEAFGSGVAQGTQMEFDGVTFVSPLGGYDFYAHTNGGGPNRFTFKNCHFIRNSGCSINIQDLTDSNEVLESFIIGNNIEGEVMIDRPNHKGWHFSSYRIYGHGNTPHYFHNAATNYATLVISTLQKGVGQYIRCVSNGVESALSYPIEEVGNRGTNAFIYFAHNQIAEVDKQLGYRLGDLSSNAKTLVLDISGTNVTISFDQNFTSMTNEEIAAFVNNQISDYATCVIGNPLETYYAEYSDVNYPFYADSIAQKGQFIRYKEQNLMLIDAADEVGKKVRGIRNCIISKNDQFAPLFETGSDVYSAGTKFSISENGKLMIDNNGKDAIAKDSNLILLTI